MMIHFKHALCLISVIAIAVFSGGCATLPKHSNNDGILSNYIDLYLSFSIDSIPMEDSLNVYVKFLNKTDSVVHFYPKGMITLNYVSEGDGEMFFGFSDKTGLLLNRVGSTKLIALEAHSTYVDSYRIAVKKDNFSKGTNILYLEYDIRSLSDKGDLHRELSGKLISNKVELFVR